MTFDSSNGITVMEHMWQGPPPYILYPIIDSVLNPKRVQVPFINAFDSPFISPPTAFSPPLHSSHVYTLLITAVVGKRHHIHPTCGLMVCHNHKKRVPITCTISPYHCMHPPSSCSLAITLREYFRSSGVSSSSSSPTKRN